MEYKINDKLKSHLKGFKYKYERIQDNLFKVYVDIEKLYLTIDSFKTLEMQELTIWIKEDNTLRVTFYTDFEKVRK